MQARRLSGSLLSALAAAALCPALLSGAPAAAALTQATAGQIPATAGGTWGTAQQIPGLAALNAGNDAQFGVISCASAGNCSAGGAYLNKVHGNFQAFVVDETNGTWGNAQEVPGTAKLNKGFAGVTTISCATAGNCTTGGFYEDANGRQQAFAATETNGTWGNAQKIVTKNPGGHAQISSVSCAAPGNCSAVGFYRLTTFRVTRVFTVSEKNGVWGTARTFPGLASRKGPQQVSSVSCPTVGNCSADGTFTDSAGQGDQAYVVSETNGTWGAVIPVPGIAALGGTTAEPVSLSCGAVGDCVVGGDYFTNGGGTEQGFVVDETNGTWGAAQNVPGIDGPDSAIESVSCVAAGSCTAVGGSPSAEVAIASESNGTWGTATPLPGITALTTSGASVEGLSCATASDCAMTGDYQDATGKLQTFVASETSGTWGNAEEIPGVAALNTLGFARANTVSCGAAGNCAAGGFYQGNNGQQAFVVNES